ncbi:OmpA family protein [Nitrosomonas mobilis]|uniref:Outer membrane protein A n=1 Tax=Nitrosomonas mobilis TaxID=51642 RepID=A0A1G5SFT1_9PROT|nr:OmpA family protein [Nitrosomonas mobilis]SCZ86056.1 Outer membrane protein A [Nitrosomonas mobilis]HNO76051.1 OmpA family protein [Nitrosomonas mobilis]
MKNIMLTKKYLISATVIPVLFSSVALAHSHIGVTDRQGFAQAEKTEAYAVDDNGAVARNSTGLCWRTGYWTPAMAIYECDPDLVKLPEKIVEAPAPIPVTEPEKVSFSADALFDFDKAVLKSEGQQALDSFASNLQGVNYDLIIAVGYTDRIGSETYNKKLSVRRAEAVKSYLVSRGINPDQIFTDGKGEANPVTGDTCKGTRATRDLINCLAPDRRVEIEVAGTR